MLGNRGFVILVHTYTQILNISPSKYLICLGRENVNVKDKEFDGFFVLVGVGVWFFFLKHYIQFKPSQFMQLLLLSANLGQKLSALQR